MKPIYLYIKQHSITKLKYFGKTYKDPNKYMGSGKHWLRHIKKHGINYVETIWYQLFTDEQELITYALNFSIQNNIVESSQWANLKNENGLDGGFDKHTQESIEKNRKKAIQRHKDGVYDYEKLRLSRMGFKQPDSQKISVAKALSKQWQITNPTGEIKIITNLNAFCKNNNLDQSNLSRGSYKGYKAIKLEA